MGRASSVSHALRCGLVGLVALACSVACSRTGLFAIDSDDPSRPDAPDGALDASSTAPPLQTAADASPDARVLAPDGGTPPPSTATSEPPAPPTTSTAPPAMPPACTPRAETCNGEDDDCDGQVDEGIVPVPCPGGGERFCVGGELSACPERCEVCIPGSERVCFLSYCTYWATQTCAADGRSFGPCHEARLPSECESVADRHKDSRELEQCCIDHGYCCRDEYDIDHDGKKNDMVGSCDEVACTP